MRLAERGNLEEERQKLARERAAMAQDLSQVRRCKRHRPLSGRRAARDHLQWCRPACCSSCWRLRSCWCEVECASILPQDRLRTAEERAQLAEGAMKEKVQAAEAAARAAAARLADADKRASRLEKELAAMLKCAEVEARSLQHQVRGRWGHCSCAG